MKDLELEFAGKGVVKGFKFRQVKASNLAYIYEVLGGNNAKWYEVFERRINKRFDVISYPGQTSFGVWAFTEETMDEAEKKFVELEARMERRFANKKSNEITPEDE